MSVSTTSYSDNFDSTPSNSLIHIPNSNDKIEISFIHASNNVTQLKSKFTLRPYEIFSFKQTDSQINLSDPYSDFFINCDSQVSCIDLLYNHVYSKLGYSILILIGTNNSTQCLSDNVDYNNFVQLYSLNFNFNTSEEKHSIADLTLLSLTPIKNDYCLKIKWIKINYETGYLFAVFLLKSGTVKICKFNVEKLSKLFKTNEPLDKRVVETECLWQFVPTPSTHKRFTCFDLSYNVLKAWVNLACGTNDGFVQIWNFNLNLFSSSSTENVDCECISSHKTIPIICGINNNLLSRGITDISFLPFPNSYVLAVGTFAKGVILWDVRFGQSEGEIKTYYSIVKPLNCVSWSPNGIYLLGGTSSGLFIDWHNKNSSTSVNSEKITKRKSANLLDNICWNVDCSEDNLYFVFDNGENIQLLNSNLGKRNISNNSIIYKWKPENEELEEEYEFEHTSDSLVESINHSMRNKFIHDLTNAKKNGIQIIKSFDGSSVDESKTQVRNKAFSLNTLVE